MEEEIRDDQELEEEEDQEVEESRGQGWWGSREAHQEAGRKGGTSTRRKYGLEHYSRLGKLGGAVRAATTDMRALGRKGGSKGRTKSHDPLPEYTVEELHKMQKRPGLKGD